MRQSEEVDEVDVAVEGPDFESYLVDLSDLPLDQLRVSGDSALAHALRRLIEDVSNLDGVIAGFQSAI